MRAIKLTLLALILLLSCKKDFNETGISKGINGYIQKGPFIAGSSVTIQILDNRFSPQGTTFNTFTNNDFGAFKIESQIQSNYVEVITQGFYFNEVSGYLSEAPITLRAISDVKGNLSSNVNILTTLTRNRIVFLVNNGGLSYIDAKKKAQNELLNIFKIDSLSDLDFNSMDISKIGDQNSILLAISTILQGSLSVADLSELISKIVIDIEPDGIINDTALINTIKSNANNLDLIKVRNNLKQRYDSANIPSFEKYAKRLIDLSILYTYPQNNDQEINFDLEKVTIRFNKQIDVETIDSMSVEFYEKQSLKKVKWTSEYNQATNQLNLIIDQELLPETNYMIKISQKVKGIDSLNLSPEYKFEFSTVNIDINKNLVVYYPIINGSVADLSGNNNYSETNLLTPAVDRNGNANSAVSFQNNASFIKYPSNIRLWNPKWTYSLWVYLDQLPTSGNVMQLLGFNRMDWDWPVPFSICKLGTLYIYNDANIYGSYVFQTKKWYHLAYVIDNQSKYVKIYANGDEIYSNDNFFFETRETSECLYLSGTSYGSAHLSFYGSVDEIRFYERALNKFEIQKLFNQ